jgi:hypothetical protein
MGAQQNKDDDVRYHECPIHRWVRSQRHDKGLMLSWARAGEDGVRQRAPTGVKKSKGKKKGEHRASGLG